MSDDLPLESEPSTAIDATVDASDLDEDESYEDESDMDEPRDTRCHISVLTLELLQEIFELAIVGFARSVAPLILGSICKTWRDIVWNYPVLWRTLLIHLPNIQGGEHETPFQRKMIKEWLERSGNQPLLIVLYGGRRYLPRSDSARQRYVFSELIAGWEPSEEVCELLLLAADRWQIFEAVGGPFENLRLKLAERDHHFPQLLAVALRETLEGSKRWNFADSPLLDEFEQCGYNANASAYIIPWRQCRLIVGNFRVRHCLPVIQEATHSKVLRRLDITLMDNWLPSSFASTIPTIAPQIETPRFLLSHLIRLKLHPCDYMPRLDEFSSFFDCVDLPALKIVNLKFASNVNDENFSSRFVRFLQRSGCQLTGLYLHGHPPLKATAALTDILRETPHLDYLSLHSPSSDFFSDPILCILDPTSDSELDFNLPKLESFIYKGKLIPRGTRRMGAILKARLRAAAVDDSNLNTDLPPGPPGPTIVKLAYMDVDCTSSREHEHQVLIPDRDALCTIYRIFEDLSEAEGIEAKLGWDWPVKPGTIPRGRFIYA